jgi:hypothetical protein
MWARRHRVSKTVVLSVGSFILLCALVAGIWCVLARLTRRDSDPGRGEVNLLDVAKGTHMEDVVQSWNAYQESLVEYLNDEFFQEPRQGNLRVLIVNPLQDSEQAAENLERSMEKLHNNSFGDTFNFALFLYQGTDAHFNTRKWYNDPNVVVRKSLAPMCKAEAWYTLEPEMVAEYDYVWLLDGDLGMDVFSWDLYRTVLMNMQPLVSQPSVVPISPGKRSSDLQVLNMLQWKLQQGQLPLLIEIARTEIMCTVLKSELWTAFHNRLAAIDRLTAWYTSDFWDLAAWMSTMQCSKSPPLLVNAAPIRHLNYHDIFHSGRCTRHCGRDGVNCRLVTEEQTELLLNTSAFQCGRDFSDLERQLGQCDYDFQIRGCRTLVEKVVDSYKMLLFDGYTASWTPFTCKNLWPSGLSQGTCFPDFQER